MTNGTGACGKCALCMRCEWLCDVLSEHREHAATRGWCWGASGCVENQAGASR